MKLKKFAHKHIYLFSISVILISTMFLGVSSSLFHSKELPQILLMNFCGRLLPSILLILLTLPLGIYRQISFHTHSIAKGLMLCVPLFLTLILFQILAWPSGSAMDLTPSFADLLGLAVTMLSVGIFEEILLRGVVFNSMKIKWGNNSNGLLKSAIASSLLFGLLHLTNLLRNPDLVLATLSQVIYATLFGIYFCGLYAKTKNIWALVLIHAIIDLIANLPEYFSSRIAEYATMDVSLFLAVFSCVMIAPFAIVGVNYLKRATVSK